MSAEKRSIRIHIEVEIKRYLIDDLEKITSHDGENAYQSAEEWHTDLEQTNSDGTKKMQLVCIEK